MATRYTQRGPAVKALLSGPNGPVVTHMRNVTSRAYELAKATSPYKTGALRESHRWVVTPGAEVISRVWAAAPYAMIVHGGSRPHVIRPRYKQALRFEVDGKVIFAKIVHHPGTKGQPWLLNAVRATGIKVKPGAHRGGVTFSSRNN